MKAITIWQPWATLLATGHKQYETRSWATKYRGPIAIHAAASEPRKLFYQMVDRIFELLGKENPLEYPRGAVIATAELVNCYKMHPYIDETAESCIWVDGDWKLIMGNEEEFGDWTPGRYAWEFTNMKMLDTPIPAKGGQRIWNWDGEV